MSILSDYFKLYRIVLSTIQSLSPETGQQLFDALSNDDYIIQEKSSNPNLVRETLIVLDNLISDGLVNAKRTATKDVPLYMIYGLSTSGQKVLAETWKPTFEETFKSYLKENGLPLSPQSVSKFIAQLIFR